MRAGGPRRQGCGDLALRGELDRVAEKIDEDLADAPGVADRGCRDLPLDFRCERESFASGGGALAPIAFTVPWIFFILAMMIFPCFILGGMYGAYRTFKGEDFEYPVIGPKIKAILSEVEDGH